MSSEDKVAMENPTVEDRNIQDFAQVELLRARHEAVKSSDFKASLDRIQEHLLTVPEEPKPVGNSGPIAYAKTEKGMHRAIAEESFLDFPERTIDTWASKDDGWTAAMSALFMLVAAIIGTGISSTSGIGGWSFAFGFISSMSVILPIGASGPLGMIQVRNRVIRRKAYKKELQRIMAEFPTSQERHEKLRRIRQAKMVAAHKALEPLAREFSLANPGQTLTISDDGSTIPEINVAQDKSYNKHEAIAAMALSGHPAVRRVV